MTVRPAAAAAPPRLPGGLPFLGQAAAYRRDPVALLRGGRERLGNVFGFHLFGRDVLALFGPEAHHAFFHAPEDQLSAQEAYRFTVPIFGKGIAYDATPQEMEAQMGLVFPALREARLQAYARVMAEEAEAYCDAWGERGEVDLPSAMSELTLFVATRCLIGPEFRLRLSTEFARLYHDLEGGLNLVAFFWPHLPLPVFRRRDRARARMVELIARIVAERRARGIEGEDFLQTLMAARGPGGAGGGMSDDAVTGLLLTLIFAGHHTSAVLAAWTGILLLQHPAALAAVQAEQAMVFGDDPRMTLDALRRLVVLERAVREAERLYPPLVVLVRKALRDFEYGGFRLPAGGLAMVSPAVGHRMPEIFREPDHYDPDRFAPGREEHRQATYSLIAFGGGRHACIGATFAYLQVKAIWSVLVRRFDLDLVDRSPAPDYGTFVAGPRRPCRVRFRRRPLAEAAPAGRRGAGTEPAT
jgi:sterol 14-demethylase